MFARLLCVFPAFFALALVALTGCNGARATAVKQIGVNPGGAGWQVKRLNGGGREYGLFVPRGAQGNQRYPMIVFLHGIGEAGSDIHKPMNVGIAPFVADNASTFPFFVLVPQSTGGWGEDSQDAADAIAAIYEVERQYPVDADRVYLTGLSTGGYGTFAIGAKYNQVFAGLVPMCPNGAAAGHAKTLAGMNIWAFENAVDPFVVPGSMAITLGAIRSEGGDPKHTVYPAFGHDCWDTAYADGAVFEWMKSHRRGGASSPVATAAPRPVAPVARPATPVATPAVAAPVSTPRPAPAAAPIRSVPPVVSAPVARPATPDTFIPAPVAPASPAPATPSMPNGKPVLPPVW